MRALPGLILSHGDLGPAALVGEWLAERGRRYEVHNVASGPLPALAQAPFVVSLGSEESVNDERLAWVAGELALLREAVAADVPVLGLCFGGQALSRALGGQVTPAAPAQVGWIEIAGELPAGPWFHWHYEQLSVPPGACELARSPAGPSAFRSGPHLGVQFHPEVTADVVADWSRSERELAALGIEPAALVAESRRQAARARGAAFELFDSWWER
jgi:GMP synthase-like glutamine amidotransferase